MSASVSSLTPPGAPKMLQSELNPAACSCSAQAQRPLWCDPEVMGSSSCLQTLLDGNKSPRGALLRVQDRDFQMCLQHAREQGAGVMVEELGALDALPEDLGSIPSIHMMIHNCL